METWGFSILCATCQPGNRSKYMHRGGACSRSWPFGPRGTAGPPPVLYIKYFRYKVLGRVLE